MLRKIEIENYKSIASMQIDLGRVNVFIGENGAGKSNILEAIALAGAAGAGKLDNEFLVSRGIRVTEPRLMRPAFVGFPTSKPIRVSVSDETNPKLSYILRNDNAPYSSWEFDIRFTEGESNIDSSGILSAIDEIANDSSLNQDIVIEFFDSFKKSLTDVANRIKKNSFEQHDKFSVRVKTPLPFAKFIVRQSPSFKSQSELLSQFVIFSPENSSLRVFQREGQIEPLGVNGEGVLKLLTVMEDAGGKGSLDDIKQSLRLLGWFKDFEVISEDGLPGARMSITDRYLSRRKNRFDQRSANEGFLFLLFYFSLFSSNLTPPFFAIDNIDASLNPKLCERLTLELARLAKLHDKQVLMTTHNPAVLDGLNLDDDEQRLFIVSRSREGYTRLRRFKKPAAIENEPDKSAVRLSETFLRGSLGGLPKSF